MIDINFMTKKRAYRMGARAEAAEETRRRIEGATVALFLERYLDQITLEDIAERAEVSVQTVLRHWRDRMHHESAGPPALPFATRRAAAAPSPTPCASPRRG